MLAVLLCRVRFVNNFLKLVQRIASDGKFVLLEVHYPRPDKLGSRFGSITDPYKKIDSRPHE